MFSKLIAKVVAFWKSLPPKVQQWLKGAETAVITGLVAYLATYRAADFTTKQGIAEFAAGIGAAMYAALRLYMTQSPIPMLVKKTTSSQTDSIGEVSSTTAKSETIVSGGVSTFSTGTGIPVKCVNCGEDPVVSTLKLTAVDGLGLNELPTK